MKKHNDIALFVTLLVIMVICYLTIRDIILADLLSSFVPPTLRLVSTVALIIIYSITGEFTIRKLGVSGSIPIIRAIACVFTIMAIGVYFADISHYYAWNNDYWFIHLFWIIVIFGAAENIDKNFGLFLLVCYILVPLGVMEYAIVLLYSGVMVFIIRYPETVHFEQ